MTLELGDLSLGCAQLGNLFEAISDDQARATVDTAWERGIRYFDTAPHYGLGLSERRLGAALAERPRDQYVVSTKAGRLLEPVEPVVGRDDDGYDVPATHRRLWDFSRDGILRSLEESLERLGLAHIDVVYLHDPDDFLDAVYATAYPTLEELRTQGVVGAVGAGMNHSTPLAELVRNTELDLVMLAGRYTLLEQRALDDLLPACVQRGTGVVAAGVFNSGLLAREQPGGRYDYADAPPELVKRAERIADVCRAHGTTLPAAAIAFPRAHPAVLNVCVGARSPEQVARNADLYAAEVPASLWEELKESGLLRADAPTSP